MLTSAATGPNSARQALQISFARSRQQCMILLSVPKYFMSMPRFAAIHSSTVLRQPAVMRWNLSEINARVPRAVRVWQSVPGMVTTEVPCKHRVRTQIAKPETEITDH